MSNYWPAFTPPQWPSFSPPLTERLLGMEISELARSALSDNDYSRQLHSAQPPWRELRVGAGIFKVTDAGLGFVAGDLFSALHIKLLAISETGMLRRCANPTCKFEPYFIALHGRQQYCSPGCSEWGQSRGKKIWWESKGTEWRKKRTSERTQIRKERR